MHFGAEPPFPQSQVSDPQDSSSVGDSHGVYGMGRGLDVTLGGTSRAELSLGGSSASNAARPRRCSIRCWFLGGAEMEFWPSD